ncbi:MAG: YmdB family metallophosphoesterase, partial [Spirochaetales bacterium]|nr:YmdB family metallophosphoesterase [Spirochaetales bacterium]
LQGRINMMAIDDPFKRVDAALREIRKRTPYVFVDFHAEATEEKEAMGFYLDGRVTAVVGTHTHVQTADEKILPEGTAYITDLGLTGVLHQVIGSRPDRAIERQLTQLPMKSEIAEGKASLQGVIIESDPKGNAVSIERFTY